MDDLQTREALLTERALEWLFTRVYSQMTGEMFLPVESLVADGAAHRRRVRSRRSHFHPGRLREDLIAI